MRLSRSAPTLALALTACASPPASPPPAAPAPPPGPSDVARYLPVDDAIVYSYKTADLEAKTGGIAVLRIRRRAGGGAEIVGLPTPQRFSFEPDGIRRVPDGGYLLKAPVVQGATWVTGPGASVRITRMGFPAKVAAGEFPSCVETTEERKGANVQGTIVTILCPDVGIVSMEARGNEANEALVHTRLELQSYGKAVDLTVRLEQRKRNLFSVPSSRTL
jgi:hypothetical protein